MSKKEETTYDEEYISKLLEQEKHDKTKENNQNEDDYLNNVLNACKKFNEEFDRNFDE